MIAPIGLTIEEFYKSNLQNLLNPGDDYFNTCFKIY